MWPKCLRYNNKPTYFQADDEGSIPFTRSNTYGHIVPVISVFYLDF